MGPAEVIKVLRQCADNIEAYQNHPDVLFVINHELAHLKVGLTRACVNACATDLATNSFLGLPSIEEGKVKFNQPFKKEVIQNGD